MGTSSSRSALNVHPGPKQKKGGKESHYVLVERHESRTEDDLFALEDAYQSSGVDVSAFLKLYSEIGVSTPSIGVSTPSGDDQSTQSSVFNPSTMKIVTYYTKLISNDLQQYGNEFHYAVKRQLRGCVRILCNIAKNHGVNLHCEEFREPGSSATLLHKALLYNHENMVEYLIELCGADMIKAGFTSPTYYGQTTIHLAVSQGNVKLVQLLLETLTPDERTQQLNTIATGTYFREFHPDGQLCLTIAAFAANGEIAKLLVKHGADLELKNVNGDTLMHRLVVLAAEKPKAATYRQLLGCFRDALKEKAKEPYHDYETTENRLKLLIRRQQIITLQSLMEIPNDDGHKPVALAAKIGSPLLVDFMHIEDIYKKGSPSKLGSISFVRYDVTDVASCTNGCYNKMSVLHKLAHRRQVLSRRRQVVNLDVLDAEPIRALVITKWSVYRVLCAIWCAWHILHMCALTVFTYGLHFTEPENTSSSQQPANLGGSLNMVPHFIGGTAGYICYLTFLMLTPVVYIIAEFLDLFGNTPYTWTLMTNQSLWQRWLKFLSNEWSMTGNAPHRFVAFAHSVTLITWCALYVNEFPHQEIALSLALLFGWCFILSFTRGHRFTGRFSIMVQKVLFYDMIHFFIIWMILLSAFTFALAITQRDVYPTYETLAEIARKLTNYITKLEGAIAIGDTNYPNYFYAVMVTYAILTIILLLNMLIASMKTSFDTVKLLGGNLWRQQQLSIMMMMERRLSMLGLCNFVCKHCKGNILRERLSFRCKYVCRNVLKMEGDIWCKHTDRVGKPRYYKNVTEYRSMDDHTSS